MKVINTRLHGMLDYLTSLVLIAPWVTGYHAFEGDTWIFAALGAITASYSVFTNYEFGLVKLVPMKVHLVFDVITALFLIVTPWMLELQNYLFYWPVVLGIFELVIIILSSPTPYILKRKDVDISRP